VDCDRILVLRPLNQEHHQECHDGVPVLMTSCHVFEKPNTGPTSAHTSTMPNAVTNALVLPVHFVTFSENRSNRWLQPPVFRSAHAASLERRLQAYVAWNPSAPA
jgi:hypothetical protein